MHWPGADGRAGHMVRAHRDKAHPPWLLSVPLALASFCKPLVPSAWNQNLPARCELIIVNNSALLGPLDQREIGLAGLLSDTRALGLCFDFSG